MLSIIKLTYYQKMTKKEREKAVNYVKTLVEENKDEKKLWVITEIQKTFTVSESTAWRMYRSAKTSNRV